MLASQFQPSRIPDTAEALRPAVRAFIAEHVQATPAGRARSWMGFDAGFSRALGAQGWIGITWPREYGGGGQSAFARYVLIEELLAAGAPVLAHWTADRQSGPLLLRFGTEEQKRAFLPAICRGECYFCIGMSEPDSGSDLASIRTRGVKVDGGWRVNGTKVWTTNAHRCHAMITLARTSNEEDRHGGLSQMIVDLAAPGVTVKPIRDLAGDADFNEVVLQDVFVPDERLLGAAGAGWSQVTAELAFERSGPERFLSSIALLVELVRLAGAGDDARVTTLVGRFVAHIATLRQMSLTIAGLLEQGRQPLTEAACVKDLGNTLEQEMPELIHALLDVVPDPDASGIAGVLAHLTQVSPSFSLRGGTREILRGIIARGLGVR